MTEQWLLVLRKTARRPAHIDEALRPALLVLATHDGAKI